MKLSKTSEAQKKAVKKYNEKCKIVKIKYTPAELSEYNRLQNYLSENNMQITSYLKQLVKNDLDSKGY